MTDTMVKVKLLCGRGGDRQSWNPGDIIEVPEDEALRMVDGRIAEFVEVSPAAPESAMRRPGRPRKRKMTDGSEPAGDS